MILGVGRFFIMVNSRIGYFVFIVISFFMLVFKLIFGGFVNDMKVIS